MYEQVEEDQKDRACDTYWAKRNTCRIMVVKPEGKEPVGRHKRVLGLVLIWILEV
jgi:hypothetical protein